MDEMEEVQDYNSNDDDSNNEDLWNAEQQDLWAFLWKHMLSELALMEAKQRRFPTHVNDIAFVIRELSERRLQVNFFIY